MCVKYDNFEDNEIIVYLNKFCYWKKNCVCKYLFKCNYIIIIYILCKCVIMIFWNLVMVDINEY